MGGLCLLLLGVGMVQAEGLSSIGGRDAPLPLSSYSRSTTRSEEVIRPASSSLSRSTTRSEEVIHPASSSLSRSTTRSEEVIRPASSLPRFVTSTDEIVDGLTQSVPVQPRPSESQKPIKVKVIQSTPDGGERETTVFIPVNSASVKLRVEFAVNSSVIRKEAYPQLADLGRALTNARLAHATVMISGHTDSDGTVTHNKWLSFRRAEAIKLYLVAHHSINPRRLQVRGFGLSLPLVPNTNAANKQINRRVEVELWQAEQYGGR